MKALVPFALAVAVAGCHVQAETSAPSPPPPPALAAPSPQDTCAGDTFGLTAEGAQLADALVARKRGTMGTATKQMVLASHRASTEAGLAMLRSGGNAVDAFVAAALVDDVVLPGVTSLAGLAGALVYESKTHALTYVHGGFADPIAPSRRWQPEATAMGAQVLVPGAPHAYAELARRFGTKPLRALVEPAAKLASDGFPADANYAASIEANAQKLRSSEYGRAAFFHDGKPIAEGSTVVLADFGRSLRSFGKDPAWFSRSPWVKEAVALVRAKGGQLEADDFASYPLQVAPPMHLRFGEADIYAGGWGGATLLSSLGALQILRGSAPRRATAEPTADELEPILRIQHAASDLETVRDRALWKQGAAADVTVAEAATTIAERARQPESTTNRSKGGAHSSSVVVIDAEGNIVVGTHTIETSNWGEGLFVGGIPLTTSGATNGEGARSASERIRPDPLSDSIVLDHGVPHLALAVYGVGLDPADVQLIDDVVSAGLDAEDAVLRPRVGFFQFDLEKRAVDHSENVADPRMPADVLCSLRQRGLRVTRAMTDYPPGIVDTGFPTLLVIRPRELHGMTPELMQGVAAGD